MTLIPKPPVPKFTAFEDYETGEYALNPFDGVDAKERDILIIAEDGQAVSIYTGFTYVFDSDYELEEAPIGTITFEIE